MLPRNKKTKKKLDSLRVKWYIPNTLKSRVGTLTNIYRKMKKQKRCFASSQQKEV